MPIGLECFAFLRNVFAMIPINCTEDNPTLTSTYLKKKKECSSLSFCDVLPDNGVYNVGCLLDQYY